MCNLMVRRHVTQFLSLVGVGLTLGLAFAHVLEVIGKMRLDGPQWLTVQQNLYVAFGPVGGAIEVLAIVFTWLAAYGHHRRSRARHLTILAAAAASAGLVEWALVVSPMNSMLNAWTAASVPVEWTAVRNRWEIGHAIQAGFFIVAFASLIIAAICDDGR
jgi:hypothetical protein